MAEMPLKLWLIAVLVLSMQPGREQSAYGQLDFEGAPVHYGQGESNDRVAKLAEALKSGSLKLKADDRMGYLPAVLEALQVPAESQTLVFSKTSFQLHKIDPDRPRAVYFNDDTYVGWVQGGEVLELASTDPDQGAMFYTLETARADGPQVLRDQGQCLICHGTLRTQGVPGYLIRSVFCNPSGRFVSGTPTYVTDHSSPFEQRWGGWYVTGQHGAMRHLGNSLCRDESFPGWIDRDLGANRSTLPDAIRVNTYLRPTSDIVALMVMEHQTQMHNLITRASFETRTAIYQDTGINEALGRPRDALSESTQRRIASVGERLMKYLLYADEIELAAPVEGSSGFAEAFSERGPKDARGRSLYALDLQKHLFKYPCSYLIYSPSFDRLPEAMCRYLGGRMNDILIRKESDAGYERLSDRDRATIVEILRDTKSDFWNTYVVASLP